MARCQCGMAVLARFEFERGRMAWGGGKTCPITAAHLAISASGMAHNEPPPVTAAGGDRALAYCMKYPRGEQF